MKKYITGFIFGLVVSFSSVGLANSELIAKYFNPTIIVDGESISLQSQPILANGGSTYLPMRELSNILGYDVTYKSDSKSIVLNNTSNTRQPKQPIQEDQNETKQVETMTLSELESQGFTFTFNYGLLIEKGDNKFQVSKEDLDKIKSSGSVLFTHNHILFSIYSKNDEILIDKSIIEAF